ncbi:MAG: hypothetical protein CMG55_00105 [Candidatus Marinimicrobia bacterium]|nr:hypothetical protein [Candidatus Neomarinimicrobiota bacterium]|tara:strand:- start:98 stop:271 length:174 start_codon:yes stop_codon:yes gene_type:complete
MSGVKIKMEERYCIVSSYSEDIQTFVFKVNQLLKEGWTLSGGLSSSSSKIFQAMEKK